MPQRYQSDTHDASPLARPLHFEYSGRTAQNRFLKGAMSEKLATWDPQKGPEEQGIPTKELIKAYQRWGEGQFGQILTGNIMISHTDLESLGNTIIPRDAPFEGKRFEAFQAMAAASKAHGSLVVGQVSHPGRQCEQRIQQNPISASDVQLKKNDLGKDFAPPHAASQEEINEVIEGFAHAAEYLEKTGYDGIQLHAAHGYLLAQFLSPTTNHRTDQYGGSLENRMRLILEIATAIRQRVSSSFILGIKINSVEFQEHGFTPEDARGLCTALEDHRFDYVEISGGTYEELGFAHKRDSTRKREGFFLEFAEEVVKPLQKTRKYLIGGMRTVGAMVGALDTVDGIGIARPVAQEFDLPKLMFEGRVSGAVEPKSDQDNFGLTNVIAGTQIRQVGHDQRPVDMSDEGKVKAFMADMQKWSEKQAADTDLKESQYVELSQP